MVHRGLPETMQERWLQRQESAWILSFCQQGILQYGYIRMVHRGLPEAVPEMLRRSTLLTFEL